MNQNASEPVSVASMVTSVEVLRDGGCPNKTAAFSLTSGKIRHALCEVFRLLVMDNKVVYCGFHVITCTDQPLHEVLNLSVE